MPGGALCIQPLVPSTALHPSRDGMAERCLLGNLGPFSGGKKLLAFCWCPT